MPFSWNVKYFDCNKQVITDYDIFKIYGADFIKKLKKKCATREEFSEVLNREMMRMFWCRSEWELIIEISEDNRIWLSPWVGCFEPENARIEVTNDPYFDWRNFATQEKFYNNKNYRKIDVYSQLKYKWDEFIDLLWKTRLRYERNHPKFDI